MTLRATLLADLFSAGFFPTGADSDEDFCISSITSLTIHNYHYKNKLKSSFSGHI